MDSKFVALQFGNGSKTHIGKTVVVEDRALTFAMCGSRKSGTSNRIVGNLDLTSYATSATACDKCSDRLPAILEMVGA